MKTVLKYTVLAGDNLSEIANNISASAGVTTSQIEQANPNIPPTALQIGQLINVPFVDDLSHTWHYTILSGDSYSGIAAGLSQCHDLTYQEIEQNNDLPSSNIQIGQILNIPATQASESEDCELTPDADNMGYWNWTWEGTNNPSNATLSLAFSGWTDPTEALQNSNKLKNDLVGTKYLTFGGGNENGKFTADSLSSINDAIQTGKLDGYDGVAYDVEEGDSGLEEAFSESFKTAKAKGLKVLVTVSHSAPYGIVDSNDSHTNSEGINYGDILIQSFFKNDQIDILSPQLYTSGEETANNYETTSDTSTTWADYASAKADIAPSIVKSSFYESAKTYFAEQGVTLKGYIQWEQV